MADSVYAPKDEELKLQKLVTTRFKESKDYFRAYRKPKLDQCYKNFRGYGGDRLAELKKIGGDDWMSNMFVPMTASHIRTIHPRTVDAKPELKVDGRTTEDMRKAIYAQAILDYVWEKANMESKMRDYVWQALVYGTTVGKVLWRTEMLIKTDKVIDEDSLEVKDVEEKKELYNDPDFEVVDIYNFYPDPYATSIDDARYVCQRYLLTKEQILRTYSGLKNTEYLTKNSGGDITDDTTVRKDILVQADGGSSGGSGQQNTAESTLFEVCEYWERNRFVLMVGDVIMKESKNVLTPGYLPFTVVAYEKLPFEFYGIGICEQLEQPQHTLNVIRNQRVDNVTLSIQKMFIANPYALISKKDLVSRPFGLIRTSDINAVKPIDVPPMNESAYREDALALDAGRMATGIDDWSRGEQGPASTTATAVTTQKESTLERIKLFISQLETDCYQKLMRYWVSMAHDLYESKTLDRITDNGIDIETISKGIDRPVTIRNPKGDIKTFVSKDDLMGYFDFRALSMSTLAATKELKLKRILDIMDKSMTAGVDPISKEMIPDLRKLWEMLFIALGMEPSQMMHPVGSPSVAQEGDPQAQALAGDATGREQMNDVMQRMGLKAPMESANPRVTPLPETGTDAQIPLQVNR